MDIFNFYTSDLLTDLVIQDEGSIKIGETIQTITAKEHWQKELQDNLAQFVIIGIGEDLGTKAIGVQSDTYATFSSFTREFLNLQDNLYLSGEDMIFLGEFQFEDLTTKLKFLTIGEKQLSELVEQVDQRVSEFLLPIFEMGKIPILIGGGQNNSYPIIKALSEAREKPVNSFNVAAHTSLKPPVGRHARNGFSHLLTEGYLNKYYVFGLHESEIPHSIYEFILANYSQIGFTRFEAILKNDPFLLESLDEATDFLAKEPIGIDVNMNCISDLILSPNHPDGFLLREVRQIVSKFCEKKQVSYLHLCEAQAKGNNDIEDKVTGKSLSLLVADFIKASTYTEDEEE